MNLDPVSLQGVHVRLEPLSIEEHLEPLQRAGEHPEIFRWFTTDHSSPDAMRTFVENARTAQREGTALPFAITVAETGAVVGSTRFGNISPEHRRVEIGWTWITPSHQRTPVNTDTKYLMLSYAFEEWDCVRVELKTDSRNKRSRAAIQRIGATEEGTLRKHLQTHQGTRDTIYYSILDDEWPAVKRDLADILS